MVPAFVSSSLRSAIADFLRFEDRAPDEFRDLGDDGVSEGSKFRLNHDIGNIINHSTHRGFRTPSRAFLPCDCSPDRREAVGVGQCALCVL